MAQGKAAAKILAAICAMNMENHSTCKCSSCSGKIEFPSEGVGMEVECPHCHQPTILQSMERKGSEQSPMQAFWRTKTAAVLIGLAMSAVIAFLFPNTHAPNQLNNAPLPSPIFPSSSSEGKSLQYGLKLPELAGMIGANLPKGMSESYYEREIRSGIETYDSNYRLTETDKQVVRNIAQILASGR